VNKQCTESRLWSLLSRNPLAGNRQSGKKTGAVRRAAMAAVEPLEHRTLLSTTIAPIADTFVRDHDYALTNFGASPLLFVKDANSGDNRVAYLKFDLSQFTAIPSAILQVSGSLENNLAGPTTTGVYAVPDSSWKEGDGTIVDSIGDGFDTNPKPASAMTWNNRPALGGAPLATAILTRDSFQTYTFDVTAYLQQQLALGNTTVTLALQNIQPTTEEVSFLSRESTSNVGSGPQLVIGDGNAAAPTAFVSAPDVTNASDPHTELVNVTYTGSSPIDLTTLNAGNITVTPYTGGSGLNVALMGMPMASPDGTIVTATYAVSDPSGSWSTADNGNFVVAVQAGTVKDITSAGVTAATGSFSVSVGDNTAPTASIAASNVTSAGGATYSFTVTYSDDVAIDTTSITLANVSVTGPVGPLTVTGMSLSPTTNASQVAVTYTASTPNGAWAAADNGPYTVTLNANQILDTAGNVAAGKSANFNVAIAVPDTTPPTATVSAPNVTKPGGATETITVVYNDDVAVDPTGINTGNITVVGPSGSSLNVTGVNTSGSGQTITAPNGAWDASDNGTYAITILSGQIADTSGNPLASTGSSFNVSAAVADTQPPTASIAAGAINSAGGASETILVTYTDNVAVAVASIGLGNLSVSGPAGPLTVTRFSVSGSGALVNATYTVAAPGGSWDATANGTYNIALNANQVKDSSGNAAAVSFASFAVNIPLPNPSDATFNAGNAVSYPFVAEATATQPDGRILLVGHQQTSNGQNQGVVKRLNADGSLDKTFGNNGQVITPAGNDEWFALTIQGTNHFVVAGSDNGDFALVRYDFSGNLDPTFGSQGVELTDFGSPTDVAYSVALSPTGQIVAAGMSNNRLAFARYNANGNIDSSFGEGGRQLLDTGAATQAIGAVTVQNDGRIVAAGSSSASIDVVRLTATGEPDSTWNNDGIMTVPGLAADTSGTGADYTIGVALQSDGKIVVANRTSSGHFGVARLKSDGTLDSAFGNGGLATANFGGADEADSVVIQDSGAILVVGTSLENGNPLTAVAAFDPTGKLITSFGENGMATFDSGTGTTARELHIGQLVLRAFGNATTNGKLLVGASASGGTQTVTSSLRRIIVPGTTSAPGIQETLLGVFGLVNGKHVKLKATLVSGAVATFTLNGGTATALQSGNDIHLEITDRTGAVLTVAVSGGKSVTFSNIDVTGNLRMLHAPAGILAGTLSVSGSAGNIMLGALQGNVAVTKGIASFAGGDLAGTFSAGGNVARLKLGNVSGNVDVTGNIASFSALDVSGSVYSSGKMNTVKVKDVTGSIVAASQIVNLAAVNLTGATILAGANLGSDGLLGGTGAAADAFGAGIISMLRVTGAISSSSFIGAGVNPTDGLFGNGNDTSAGAGLIKNIFARSADSTTHFEAASFGIARLPAKVVVTTDARFIVL
jgi:uncharacterized delta-60 repeat protein